MTFGRGGRRRRGAATDAGSRSDAARGSLRGVPWRRLFAYLRPHLALFGLAIAFLLIGTAGGLLLPLVIGGLVGEVVSAGDAGGLDELILVMIGLAVVLAVSNFVQTWSLGVIGERIVARLRSQLFERLTTLELDFYVKRRVGELISRLSSDVTMVRTMLTQSLTTLLSSLLSLIGSVAILFVLSPALLVVVLALAPALVIVAIVVGRPLRRLSTRVQDAIADSTTTAEEALGGIRVVKSFGRESWEQERYAGDLAGVVGTAIRLVTWRGLFGGLMTFLGFGALVIILWYTGHQVIEGVLTFGALTSFLLYGVAIGTSLGTIAGLYGQFQEGAGAVQRVFELIDEEPTIVTLPAVEPLGRVAGRITFDGVTFGYDPERPVLRDIDLEVAAGEIIGIVGPSGAGKTTICNLVPRLWDVTAGTVRVDGRDVRELDLHELRRAIALVPQDANVFGGTIGANIRYGRLDATDEEIADAARAANAADFIDVLPDGYDTLIGDRGTRLSGGQRQRVAIARAILKDAPILILDEATSSLDSQAERLVQDALETLMRGRTTLIVAHRLSTIRHADRIAVFDDGYLLELGTHGELIDRDGLYAHLWRLQAAERPSEAVPTA